MLQTNLEVIRIVPKCPKMSQMSQIVPHWNNMCNALIFNFNALFWKVWQQIFARISASRHILPNFTRVKKSFSISSFQFLAGTLLELETVFFEKSAEEWVEILPYSCIYTHQNLCSEPAFIPFYSILFHFISFYSILFHFIPFYSILFHFIQFYSILFYFIPFYSILFHSIPFYSILFHFIPFYSILFHFFPFCFNCRRCQKRWRSSSFDWVFSRVHPTLYVTMSVCRLVSP